MGSVLVHVCGRHRPRVAPRARCVALRIGPARLERLRTHARTGAELAHDVDPATAIPLICWQQAPPLQSAASLQKIVSPLQPVFGGLHVSFGPPSSAVATQHE